MQSTGGRRRLRLHETVGVVIYAAFLLTAQFTHHDLLCHLKSPLHCTACTSSLVSADPDTATPAAAIDLADAGRTVSCDVLTDGFLLAARSTGRSPPTIS